MTFCGLVINYSLITGNKVSKGILGIRDLGTQNILMGFGICLLPWKRDLPKFGHGIFGDGIFLPVCREFEDAAEAVPVNFLSKTVRMRTGQLITLSYRALSS